MGFKKFSVRNSPAKKATGKIKGNKFKTFEKGNFYPGGNRPPKAK